VSGTKSWISHIRLNFLRIANLFSGWRNTNNSQLLGSHWSSRAFCTSHLLENITNKKCKTAHKKQKHTKLEVQKQKHIREEEEEDNTFKNERNRRTSDSRRRRALPRKCLKLSKKAMER
jgi:hypothetical protein